MYIDLVGKYTSKDGKESNTKSFSFYFNSGLYRSKKVEYSGETKFKHGSLGWGVDNKYADGKGIGKIEGIGIFDGEWSQGNMKNGKLSFLKGETFTVEFAGNIPNWKGEFNFKNGNRYVGNFQNGDFHEMGLLVVPSGKKQEGQFANGTYIGGSENSKPAFANAEILKYKSGQNEGQLKNGVEKGLGKFTYTNGAVYKGSWKNGLPNGKGKMSLNDGTDYEGILQMVIL